MTAITVVYTTVGSLKDAKRLVTTLVDAKAAGCVVYMPAASVYTWNGKRASAKEYVLLCKTTVRGARKLVVAVEKLHPYDTPCILTLHVDANDAYVKWLNS